MNAKCGIAFLTASLAVWPVCSQADDSAQRVLVEAARDCQLEATRAALLNPSVDVNGEDDYGNDLLESVATRMYSSAGACDAVGLLLLDKGANVDAMSRIGSSALNAAIDTGKATLAIELLKRGAKDIHFGKENTPIASAAKGPSAEVFRYLVNRGDDLATKTASGETLLMMAAEYDRVENAELLLQKGLRPDTADNEGKTAIFHAMYGRPQYGLGDRPNTPPSLRMVKRLVDSGASIDLRSPMDGTTPVIAAAARRYYPDEVAAVIKYLLARGASATSTANNSASPLLLTCENGYFEASLALVEAGADVNARFAYSELTPLHNAVNSTIEPSLDLVKLLVEKGADVNAKANGFGVLVRALYPINVDQSEIVAFLLSKGADPRDVSPDGGNTIIYAAAKNQPRSLKLLVEAGADPHFVGGPGIRGGNALTWAARGDSDESVRILLNLHVDPNVAMADGDTALMYAAAAGHLESVKALVEAGANVNARNLAGGFALRFARFRGHTAIQDYLLTNGAHD